MILPMLLLVAQTSRPSATYKNTVQQPRQQQNQQAMPEKDYSADLRAISQSLRAIHEEQTKAEATRAQQKQPNGPPIWSNWVLVIVAAGAGWTAYRAFNHERDAVRLTERADLLIDAVDLVPSTNPSVLTRDTAIRFQFRNFGPTRASDVHFEEIRVEIEGAQSTYPSDAPPLPRGVVGAGDTIDAAFPSLGQVFETPAILSASRGDTKLAFTIRIAYTDVFGRRHHTTTGGTYYGPGGGFLVEGDARAD